MSPDSDMQSQAQLDAIATDVDMSFEQTQPASELQSDEHPPCPHISKEFEVEATRQSMQKKYKSAIVWGAQTGAHGQRRKMQVPSCGTCALVLHRPWICLHCSYGGCWTGGHIVNHLRDLGHRFCADVKTGSVYCLDCDDLIRSRDFSEIYQSTTLAVEEKETRFISSKKRREPYRAWSASAKDKEALEGMTPLSCQGRRGLLNLGQTCYLNAVLQCLLHNPMLRNYFLSDRHNCKKCTNKECMCCEMDKLFTEVHSGNIYPYGPTTLLALTWRASEELAGYAQHDAHEFLIFALNRIHESARGSTKAGCNCIVHSVFAGALQSDQTCNKCGETTSKADPMFDVSLQLSSKDDDAKENTLYGCLRRFTQSESMKFSCSKCGGSSQSGTKRLSIKKLPPVLIFQLKRFEHEGQGGRPPKKIGTHIRFPSTINMAPFTTLSVSGVMEKPKKGDKDKQSNPIIDVAGPLNLYNYELFAVVSHEGQIDNGHYTCYARSQDEWYLYDDDKVTHATLESVLKTTAYMCFYIKRHLDYKPFSSPTYRDILKDMDTTKEKDKKEEKESRSRRETTVEDELLAIA